MKYYNINIAGLQRSLPLCPINESIYIGAFIIFGDPELCDVCAKALRQKVPEFDYIMTAEAKGIPLAHDMARYAGNNNYIVARKSPKLYMTGVFEASVHSISTAKEQTLYLDVADAEKIRGKRILLVDDVISLGESLHALEGLVEQAGGIVCGKATILAEGNAAKRDDIIYLQRLPLFDRDGNEIE